MGEAAQDLDFALLDDLAIAIARGRISANTLPPIKASKLGPLAECLFLSSRWSCQNLRSLGWLEKGQFSSLVKDTQASKTSAQRTAVPTGWICADQIFDTRHYHRFRMSVGSALNSRAFGDRVKHGIRARAEELVYRELGPQTQLEKDVKRARQTGAEYLTEIDRSLKRMADQDGAVNLDDAPLKYRPTNSARLKTLERLGLAQQVSGSNWLLAQGFDRTLKEVGERRNIIKQLHRALGDRQGRTVRPDVDLAMPITGRILRTGMKGEGHGSVARNC